MLHEIEKKCFHNTLYFFYDQRKIQRSALLDDVKSGECDFKYLSRGFFISKRAHEFVCIYVNHNLMFIKTIEV